MFESFLKKEPERLVPNTLKSEHLINGERPIVSCIEGREDEKGIPLSPDYVSVQEQIKQLKAKSSSLNNIDYYADPRVLNQNSIANYGAHTFAISPVNKNPKYTEGLKNCTSVAIVGREKITEENISVLSHQDPWEFLPWKDASTGKNISRLNIPKYSFSSRSFIKAFHSKLLEMKERCLPGSIDAVIIGGNYSGEEDWKEFRDNYFESIQLLQKEVFGVFGFDPVVIVGPKIGCGEDNVFFDTENRRLYVDRPWSGDSSSESYLPNDIKTQEEKWKNES